MNSSMAAVGRRRLRLDSANVTFKRQKTRAWSDQSQLCFPTDNLNNERERMKAELISSLATLKAFVISSWAEKYYISKFSSFQMSILISISFQMSCWLEIRFVSVRLWVIFLPAGDFWRAGGREGGWRFLIIIIEPTSVRVRFIHSCIPATRRGEALHIFSWAHQKNLAFWRQKHSLAHSLKN